jgi:hypothetical protein
LELASHQSGKKNWTLEHEVAFTWRTFYLLKVVLEGKVVYWMALAAIPASVLNKLCKMMFNFLWSGCSIHSRQHLCSWQTLAKPKNKGGWGIQNPLLFSQALAASTLWCILIKPGIWHTIILDKYLCHHSVKSWLSVETDIPRSTSYFWKNLLKAKRLITTWLCWHPGSGHTIDLDRDCILGMNASARLTPQLISHLNTKHISFLSQIRASCRSDAQPDSWITNTSLGLTNDVARDWENFCLALTQLGIHLTPMTDLPHWIGGDRSGFITAQNVYAAITNLHWTTNLRGWKHGFWDWNLPPKIKFFTWLLFENKINSWENLLKKGWTGPSYCSLCKSDSESTEHLFNKCVFFKQVWKITALALKTHSSWEGITLATCFDSWTRLEKIHRYLPPYICWTVWLERNLSYF